MARSFSPLPPSLSRRARHPPARRALRRDLRAEVGIGTMIVFIASILVAAIAAGVLISTSQKLQSKSLQTGLEATRNVASGLKVVDVDGVRSGTAVGDPVHELEVWVNLAAGADPVDLSTMAILVTDGNTQVQITSCVPGGVVAANTEFATTVVRGGTTDCGVVSGGDLVILHLGEAGGAPVPLLPGGLTAQSQVQIQFVPLAGIPLWIRFTTPELGSDLYVDMF